MASLDDFICGSEMYPTPVALTMTGGTLAAEKARMVAEKARAKDAMKDAMKDAKLVAAMHQIKMLKAFIKAAGLKIPPL